MSIFVPQVSLKVGEENLTPIPPEYMQEFTYRSTLGGFYTIETSLFEPWDKFYEPGYVSLEDKILRSALYPDEPNKPLSAAEMISFMIGILDDTGMMTYSEELNTALNNFDIKMTDAGIETNLTCHAWQLALINSKGFNGGKTYTGRRSVVVEKIAAEYGMKSLVEMTDDSDYELNQDGGETSSQKEWSLGAQTPMQFVNNKLLKGARSLRDKRTDYEFQMRPGNLIVFAPPMTRAWGRTIIPEFEFLFANQGEVLEFNPDFNSKILGAWGRSGYLARKYNPHTKEFTLEQIQKAAGISAAGAVAGGVGFGVKAGIAAAGSTTDFEGQKLSVNAIQRLAKSAKGLAETTAHGDFSPENSSIVHGVASANSNDMNVEVEETWSKLNDSVFNASITLMGDRKTIGILAGDVIYVAVKMPDGRLHWSSGYWLVTEATHTIANTYTVTCNLQRDFSGSGEIANPSWDRVKRLFEKAEDTYQVPDEDYTGDGDEGGLA